MNFREYHKELRKRIDEKSKGLSYGDVQKLNLAWLDEQITSGVTCQKCGLGNEAILTVDHIVPRSIIDLFGLFADTMFDEENLQVYCKRCNHFKASRLDFTNQKTKQLLLKYINQIT